MSNILKYISVSGLTQACMLLSPGGESVNMLFRKLYSLVRFFVLIAILRAFVISRMQSIYFLTETAYFNSLALITWRSSLLFSFHFYSSFTFFFFIFHQGAEERLVFSLFL